MGSQNNQTLCDTAGWRKEESIGKKDKEIRKGNTLHSSTQSQRGRTSVCGLPPDSLCLQIPKQVSDIPCPSRALQLGGVCVCVCVCVQQTLDGEEHGLQGGLGHVSPAFDWEFPKVLALRSLGGSPRPSHLRPEALPHCSTAEGLKRQDRVISAHTPRSHDPLVTDCPVGVLYFTSIPITLGCPSWASVPKPETPFGLEAAGIEGTQ